MKRQIVEALESIIIGDLRQAYLHLDVVEFKDVLTTIKEVIQHYEDNLYGTWDSMKHEEK